MKFSLRRLYFLELVSRSNFGKYFIYRQGLYQREGWNDMLTAITLIEVRAGVKEQSSIHNGNSKERKNSEQAQAKI